MPRYLYVEEGVFLGDPDADPRGLLLAEQPDGSWRRALGEDLVEIHARFPNFIRSTQKPPWKVD
jgi:hypothetical protein